MSNAEAIQILDWLMLDMINEIRECDKYDPKKEELIQRLNAIDLAKKSLQEDAK